MMAEPIVIPADVKRTLFFRQIVFFICLLQQVLQSGYM